MRSARLVVPCLLVIGAAACSITPSASTPEPQPVRRYPATSAKTLGVPPGHLPPVGQCRVWVPGMRPGHQARARSCSNIERDAPKGSWILYRPAENLKVVQVREIDERRPGVVIHMRVYDAEKGTLVRGG
jgi:hypothetical protein